MNEQIFAGCIQDAAETLLALERGKDWHGRYPSFLAYCKARWGMNKTTAERWLKFAKFLRVCRQHGLRLPETPEVVDPVLSHPAYEWLNVWQYCIERQAFTPGAMTEIGVGRTKQVPPEVRKKQALRRAVNRIADQEDGERVIDELGPNAGGKRFDKAVKVMIEMDEASRSEV